MGSENAQKIIYILGNGFDIAANLPTRYTDFMCFIDNWKEFYDEYALHYNTDPPSHFLPCPSNGKLNRGILLEYARYRTILSEENIQKLDTIIRDNAWIEYFHNCNYMEPGWAGFEKEIKEAIMTVDTMFRNNYVIHGYDMGPHQKAVHAMCCKALNISITPDAGFAMRGNEEQAQKERKEIINILARQLIGFTEAFRLYLLEFVERIDIKNDTGIIVNNAVQTYVVSLNYTHQQILNSGIKEDHIHLVHGSDEIENNLVMGIDKDLRISNEFIRFKKFFQRIQKRTGANYKQFFSGSVHESCKVIFFGHSLDPIDSDFIKDIVLSANTKIYIHYCSQEDYEDKVINCVDIFSEDYVIDAVSQGRIVFTDKKLIEIPTL